MTCDSLIHRVVDDLGDHVRRGQDQRQPEPAPIAQHLSACDVMAMLVSHLRKLLTTPTALGRFNLSSL